MTKTRRFFLLVSIVLIFVMWAIVLMDRMGAKNTAPVLKAEPSTQEQQEQKEEVTLKAMPTQTPEFEMKNEEMFLPKDLQ